jgi:hypothetical protein
VCTTVCRPPRLRNVTLERRDGRPYYFTGASATAVRKVYVASGELAQTLALADEAIRHLREEERRWEREELERLEALAAPLEELSEAAGLLTRAHLVAAGWHRHNGEWRRRRGR